MIEVNSGDYIFYKSSGDTEEKTKLMSRETFDRIGRDVAVVLEVCRVEQLYHMLVQAVMAFDGLVVRRCECMRFASGADVEDELFRTDCNQYAANFLTVLQMYRDYISPDGIESKFGVSKALYNKLPFRFCKALRNYIQHEKFFPITLSSFGGSLAMGEWLRSSLVLVPSSELLATCNQKNDEQVEVFSLLAKQAKEVDLSQMFLQAMDFIREIHLSVRACPYCGSEYEKVRNRLLGIEREYLALGMTEYRYDDDPQMECRGTIPYLAQRQIGLVDYFRRRYACNGMVANTYVSNIPQETIERAAWADKDVSGLVKAGGVVARFEKEDRTILSSKYQGSKMRGWYGG